MKPEYLIAGILAAMVGSAVVCIAAERRAKKSAPAAGLDAVSMLEAIAQVESGNNPHAVSTRGERGRCQFTAVTWYHYTTYNFETWAASGSSLVAGIEHQHYLAILSGLYARGLTPTPELVAAAWRHGVAQASAHRNDGYAIRAGNLYRDFIARRE